MSDGNSEDDSDAFQSAEGEPDEFEPEFFESSNFQVGDIVKFNAEAETYRNLGLDEVRRSLRSILSKNNPKRKPKFKALKNAPERLKNARKSLEKKIENKLQLGIVLRVDNDTIKIHFEKKQDLKTISKNNKQLKLKKLYVENTPFHYKMFCKANSDPEKAKLYEFMFKNPDLQEAKTQALAKKNSRNFIRFADKISEGQTKCLSPGLDLQNFVEKCLDKDFRKSNVQTSFAVERGRLSQMHDMRHLQDEQTNGTGFYKDREAAFPNGFIDWLSSMIDNALSKQSEMQKYSAYHSALKLQNPDELPPSDLFEQYYKPEQSQQNDDTVFQLLKNTYCQKGFKVNTDKCGYNSPCYSEERKDVYKRYLQTRAKTTQKTIQETQKPPSKSKKKSNRN